MLSQTPHRAFCPHARGTRCVSSRRGAGNAADAGRDVRARRPVHSARPRCHPHRSRAAPTGLYALRPRLSNETILGLERVTAMQKRLTPTATMVGVNADMFTGNGRPSGMLMHDGVVDAPPHGAPSSIGSPRRAHSTSAASSSSAPGGVSASGDAEQHQRGSGRERRVALHAALRPGNALRAGRVGTGRHRSVSAFGAQRRSRRARGAGRRRGQRAHPARTARSSSRAERLRSGWPRRFRSEAR